MSPFLSAADVAIPSAGVLQDYEQLTIVGILLLVLAVCLGVLLMLFRQFIRWGNAASKAHSEQIAEQTRVLTTLTEHLDGLKDSHTELHRRLDNILLCPDHDCPVRPKRKNPNAINPNPKPIAT